MTNARLTGAHGVIVGIVSVRCICALSTMAIWGELNLWCAAFMVSRPQDSEKRFLWRPGDPGAPPGQRGAPRDHLEGWGGPHRPSVAVRELQL